MARSAFCPARASQYTGSTIHRVECGAVAPTGGSCHFRFEFTGKARRLDTGTRNPAGPRAGRNKALDAALKRGQASRNAGSARVLGGSKTVMRVKNPAQLAAEAAERRKGDASTCGCDNKTFGAAAAASASASDGDAGATSSARGRNVSTVGSAVGSGKGRLKRAAAKRPPLPPRLSPADLRGLTDGLQLMRECHPVDVTRKAYTVMAARLRPAMASDDPAFELLLCDPELSARLWCVAGTSEVLEVCGFSWGEFDRPSNPPPSPSPLRSLFLYFLPDVSTLHMCYSVCW